MKYGIVYRKDTSIMNLNCLDIDKVEKILKGSPDWIPPSSASVEIQIIGGKVCLRCKGKTFLALSKNI